MLLTCVSPGWRKALCWSRLENRKQVIAIDVEGQNQGPEVSGLLDLWPAVGVTISAPCSRPRWIYRMRSVGVCVPEKPLPALLMGHLDIFFYINFEEGNSDTCVCQWLLSVHEILITDQVTLCEIAFIEHILDDRMRLLCRCSADLLGHESMVSLPCHRHSSKQGLSPADLPGASWDTWRHQTGDEYMKEWWLAQSRNKTVKS